MSVVRFFGRMPWPLLVVGYVAIVTCPVSAIPRYEVEPWDTTWNVADNPSFDSQAEDWGKEEDKPWRHGIYVTKRALSVLSRWKPLTSAFSRNIGSGSYDDRRFSARSAMFPREQSRALLRPAGQPLRWGR